MLAGRVEWIGRPAVRVKIAKGGLVIPAFEKTLTREEIDAIIEHLASTARADGSLTSAD